MLATQQLTEFLATVADRPDEPVAQHAAVVCVARALDADVAVLIIGHAVAAAVGIDPADVPLDRIADGPRTLRLDQRDHTVAYAEIAGGMLVLARSGPVFGPDEVTLLNGFARVLDLSRQALLMLDSGSLPSNETGLPDPLTGLAGRALFLTRLEAAQAARTAGVGVLFIDLDRFKVVNDSLGHAAGDEVLRQSAVRIERCLRKGDTAARLGGDEFAVLVPDVADTDQLVHVARRLLDSLNEPFDLGGQDIFVGASIGISHSAGAGADTGDLMVRADLAMYQAKKHAKDRFQIFEPAMQAEFQAKLQMETDLRRAVVRNEFVLRYQPIVHLRTGEVTGLEALVRWEHPERGLIPPLDFIPLAEETGMIVPIGEWVLHEACRQTADWNRRRTGRPLTVSVNLSAVQLDQNTVPEVVAAVLAETGLPPACLVIELTESLLVDHRQNTLQQLERIKATGVRLAIDDFGTGYSSLAYLRRFPVDIIKIDKSFVDEVSLEPAAAALTLGIIQLGRALHLSTIAEGIEDAGQLSELTDGNCELGQGYFFAEPLTEKAVATLIFPPRS